MDPNRSKRDMARYQQPARGGYSRPGSGNRLPANDGCGCSGAMNHDGSMKNDNGGSKNRSMNQSMNCSMEKIDQYPIAMAYVPWQKYGDTFDLETGFRIGTIFPELDQPFMRAGCLKK